MQDGIDGSSKSCDLIIIGAGIYGVQACRTYLELHPTASLVILESSDTVGGVWSRDRVYNDFWTQTPLGILEFSDQPMHNVSPEDQHYGFFRASHVAKYLEDYCSSHTYDGVSLASRIRFGTLVTKLEKDNGLWHVSTSTNGHSGPVYKAPRVVDASGLTSQPNWPDLPEKERFKGEILHHKDFSKWEGDKEGNANNRILVIGGAKSAADVAYSCAKAGHKVTWIIRRSGSGPAAFVSAKGSFGYANSNESFYTRFTSIFLASIFAFKTGYDRLLGWVQSSSGQKLLRRVWQRINSRAWKEADYDRPDGRKNGFQNLKPDTELFWQNDSTGVNQREDFFDVIAKHVSTIREDISHMTEQGLVTENGTVVETDTIICATGWKIGHPYFDQRTAARLGLPVPKDAIDSKTEAHWNDLYALAEKDVFERLPILNSTWAHTQVSKDRRLDDSDTTPFQLWKCMVPLHDSSIVFVGKMMLGNHFRNAEVQALFASAVLSGLAKLPSLEEREMEVAKTITWCRKRYPAGKGKLGHWLYWDMVPYTDSLLSELGLRSHRSSSLWQDLFRPCFAKDLEGLIDELKGAAAVQSKITDR